MWTCVGIKTLMIVTQGHMYLKSMEDISQIRGD